MTTAEQIDVLRNFPAKLEALVTDLTPEELTTAYNAPEWTVAQNVHHLADAHMNGYIRFKLAFTEDNPPFKGYIQPLWAETADAKDADIRPSLMLLRALHQRWVVFLESIEDWSRTGVHPDRGPLTLAQLLEIYVGHCAAHTKQIQEVLDKMPK
jgi:hypothetical protein